MARLTAQQVAAAYGSAFTGGKNAKGQAIDQASFIKHWTGKEDAQLKGALRSDKYARGVYDAPWKASKFGSYAEWQKATGKGAAPSSPVPKAATPQTAAPKIDPNSRQGKEALGYKYLGSMKEVEAAQKAGQKVEKFGADYYVAPAENPRVQRMTDIGGAQTRKGIEAQGYQYIGSLEEKDNLIRQGKNLVFVNGSYYVKKDTAIQTTDGKRKEIASKPFSLDEQLSEITDPRQLITGLGITAPEVPNLTKLYDTLRKEQNIEVMEEDLASIDDAIDQLDAQYRAGAGVVEGEFAPMSILEGRQKELYKQYSQQREQVVAERESVSRRLEMKYNTISTLMDLTQKDYANARESYNDLFSQTLSVMNYVSQERERAFNRDMAEKDDARANLTVLLQQMQDGNISWSSMSSKAKAQVSFLEQKAGFPAGFTQSIRIQNPDSKVISTSSRTDPSGIAYADMIMQDRNGQITVRSVRLGAVKTGGGGGPTQEEILAGYAQGFRNNLTDITSLGFPATTQVATKGEETANYWRGQGLDDRSANYISREQLKGKLQAQWGWVIPYEFIEEQVYTNYTHSGESPYKKK